MIAATYKILQFQISLKTSSIILLIAWLAFFSPENATAAELDRIQSTRGHQLELLGQFGKNCNKCEIIVDYGKGFLYAYKPKSWSQHKLIFTLKDLGKSLKVKIVVRTASGDSKARAYIIKPILIPAQLANKTRPITAKNRHLVLQKSHSDPFGDKGMDVFKVNSKTAKCNETVTLFHDARIVIVKKRFGDARIEHRPTSGCVKCSPLKVRWYHEPTGLINYQLHVQRREIKGQCASQIRRK